jgi:XRE family transcriptional regulator, regulator of sulfur utilization
LEETKEIYYVGIGLNRLRRGKKWTQEELAEHSNLNRKYIGELELNKKTPSISTVFALADALGIERGAFVTEL